MPFTVSRVHLGLCRGSTVSGNAHLNIFADRHDGPNERLMNLLAAAGGHDQPARRLLGMQAKLGVRVSLWV